MFRTHEFKLYPTREQVGTLGQWLCQCCWVYNQSLEHRKKAYARRGKSPTLYDRDIAAARVILDRALRVVGASACGGNVSLDGQHDRSAVPVKHEVAYATLPHNGVSFIGTDILDAAETLQGNIVRNVEQEGSVVYTDAATAYFGLNSRYAHACVDHVREYVRGSVHTNGLENFWSLFKRAIKGTWTHIAPFHVDRYADEQSWRYNNRKKGDGSRFNNLLRMVVGKRLTYRQLCCIDDAGFMGIE